MKWGLLIILIVLAACTRHVDTTSRSFVDPDSNVRPDRETVARPDAPVAPNTTNTTLPAPEYVLSTGTFSSESYRGSGTAAIIVKGGQAVLRLKSFQSERGVDMRIYLAADLGANDAIDLGAVQGYSGTYDYPIPTGTDIKRYPYVLVWSRQAEALFSSAELR